VPEVRTPCSLATHRAHRTRVSRRIPSSRIPCTGGRTFRLHAHHSPPPSPLVWHACRSLRVVHTAQLATFSAKFRTVISEEGELNALGGWFDTDFRGSMSEPAPNPVTLTTEPESTTHWAQQVFLIHPPHRVEVGDTLEGTVKLSRQHLNHRLLWVQVTMTQNRAGIGQIGPERTLNCTRTETTPCALRKTPPRLCRSVWPDWQSVRACARACLHRSNRLIWRAHEEAAKQPRSKCAMARGARGGGGRQQCSWAQHVGEGTESEAREARGPRPEALEACGRAISNLFLPSYAIF
jgi:hypothetical protein